MKAHTLEPAEADIVSTTSWAHCLPAKDAHPVFLIGQPMADRRSVAMNIPGIDGWEATRRIKATRISTTSPSSP